MSPDDILRDDVAAHHAALADMSAHRDGVFFAAVEKTRMPMTIVDARQVDYPIIFANDAFLEMTGYSEHEVIGRNCRFLQGPETDRRSVQVIRSALSENREMATEILNYRKDGSTFWNALFISPVYAPSGELIYFFASQLDVSRRRDAEDALRQAQKMEALGQLTGGIAHDFNNLLQVMVGHLDLMEMSLKGTRRPFTPERTQQTIDSVKQAVSRASTLTQQLLAFSRKQRLDGRTVNLNAVLEKMSDLMQRTVGADVELIVAREPDLPNAKLDPTQIEVALLNVLANSRDALAGRGARRVEIATATCVIDEASDGINDLRQGRYVQLSITDNGSGIDPDIIGRVLDPFFSTKEEGQGTGLGLSMVYGFAKQSCGTVTVASEPGAGTTIALYFPVAEGAIEAAPVAPRAIDQPGAETVMVVDDRPEVADLAQAMLEEAGYTVHVSYSPGDALAKMAVLGGVDLLFSDVIMPGNMNGVMLAREAIKRHPEIKVLLTTGYADESIERTDAAGERFDVLHKPYRQTDLARRVRIVFEGHTGV
ncbi:histidine kinase famiy protein [Schauerella aestuarii]|uniref:histidine kinase famiy protein n=1 Tax=Schauerella aestuarii TaxID=2511204 RepID=UPI00136ED65D|nr:histidine kinase famiy protein [Achromobacter aestuarii]MYZ41557.1 PAS domain-containing protein [Achromobacter aestuarii]